MRIFSIDFGERMDGPRGIFSRTETLPNGEFARLQSSYRLDRSSVMLSLGAQLSPNIADLLDIGVAAVLADRVSPRSRTGRVLTIDESGVRYMRIRIPVRIPEHWSQPKVHQELSNALLEMTGDDWEFEFVPRRDQLEGCSEQIPLEIPTALGSIESVLIYSGGLDSLLGLLQLVEEIGHRSVVLASVSTHDRLSHVQSATAAEVRDYHRLDLLSWRMRFGLTRDFPRNERESTQRARAFLFLLNGIAAGLSSGLSIIHVFENGIGALNLPYTLGQLGHRSNRAMHPRTLQAVARFASEALDQHIEIVNPALWQTKQQIARRFGGSPAFQAAAPKTVSCDRFPYKPEDQPCGVCTSCILRCLSLSGTNLDVMDAEMPHDRDAFVAAFQARDRRSLVPLVAMNGQVEHLRSHLPDLDDPELLLRRFPDLAEVLDACISHGEDIIITVQRLHDLFAAYVNEWTSFVSRSNLFVDQVTRVPHSPNFDERRVIAS